MTGLVKLIRNLTICALWKGIEVLSPPRLADAVSRSSVTPNIRSWDGPSSTGGMEAAMPHSEEERTYGIGLLVDCCSDIRFVWQNLQARGPTEKLDGSEAVAQEADTKALSALEEGLYQHYDTLLELGLSHDQIREIVAPLLPTDRYEQLVKKKDAVHT